MPVLNPFSSLELGSELAEGARGPQNDASCAMIKGHCALIQK